MSLFLSHVGPDSIVGFCLHNLRYLFKLLLEQKVLSFVCTDNEDSLDNADSLHLIHCISLLSSFSVLL